MSEAGTHDIAGPGSQPIGPLPLFYTRPEGLNPVRHGSLAIVSKSDFAFAADTHVIPVIVSEMPAAMRSYPIVFVGPAKNPVVITGLRPKENLFVGKDGKWAEPHYVPAYVRRYPFILADDRVPGGRMMLCIDRDCDRVVENVDTTMLSGGATISALFDGDQPSELTKQALEYCQKFQINSLATRQLVEKLDEHKLFAPRQSKVTLEGGETFNVVDFQVIDEAALNNLSDEAFLDLRRSGAMTMIYSHLASTNSWNSLLYQAKLRKSAA